MEVDVITLQELFTYKIEQVTGERVVVGSLVSDRAAADVPQQVREARDPASGRPLPGEPAARPRGRRPPAMKALTRLGGLAALAAAVWVGSRVGGRLARRSSRRAGRVYPAARLHPHAARRRRRSHARTSSVTENGQRVTGRDALPGRGHRRVRRRSCSRSTPRRACRAGRSPMRSRPPARLRRRWAPTSRSRSSLFNNGVHVIQPFTTDRRRFETALATAPKLAVGTKIYDAIEAGAAADRGDRDRRMPRSSCSPTVPTSGASPPAPKVLQRSSALSRARVLGRARLEDVQPEDARRHRLGSKGEYVEALGPEQLKPIFGALGQQLSQRVPARVHGRMRTRTRTLRSRCTVKGVPGVARDRLHDARRCASSRRRRTSPSAIGRVIQST